MYKDDNGTMKIQIITSLIMLFLLRDETIFCTVAVTHLRSSSLAYDHGIDMSRISNHFRFLKDQKPMNKPKKITRQPTLEHSKSPSSKPIFPPTNIPSLKKSTIIPTMVPFHQAIQLVALRKFQLVVTILKNSVINYESLTRMTELQLYHYFLLEEEMNISLRLIHLKIPKYTVNNSIIHVRETLLLDHNQELVTLSFEGSAIFDQKNAPFESLVHDIQIKAFVDDQWKNNYLSKLQTSTIFEGLINDAYMSLDLITSPSDSILPENAIFKRQVVNIREGGIIGGLVTVFLIALVIFVHIYKKKNHNKNVWIKEDSQSISDSIDKDDIIGNCVRETPHDIFFPNTKRYLDENTQVTTSSSVVISGLPTKQHTSESNKQESSSQKEEIDNDEYSLAGESALEGTKTEGDSIIQRIMASINGNLSFSSIIDNNNKDENEANSTIQKKEPDKYESASPISNVHNKNIYDSVHLGPKLSTILEKNAISEMGTDGVEVMIDNDSDNDVIYGENNEIYYKGRHSCERSKNKNDCDSISKRRIYINDRKVNTSPDLKLKNSEYEGFNYLKNSSNNGRLDELREMSNLARVSGTVNKHISLIKNKKDSKQTNFRDVDDFYQFLPSDIRKVDDNVSSSHFFSSTELPPQESRYQPRITVVTEDISNTNSSFSVKTLQPELVQIKNGIHNDIDESSCSYGSYVGSDFSYDYDDCENSLIQSVNEKELDVLSPQHQEFHAKVNTYQLENNEKDGILSIEKNRRCSRIDIPVSSPYNYINTKDTRSSGLKNKIQYAKGFTPTIHASLARRHRLTKTGCKSRVCKKIHDVDPNITRILRKERLRNN